MTLRAQGVEDSVVPRFPLGDRIEEAFDWVEVNLATFFDVVTGAIETIIDELLTLLTSPEPLVLAVILALLALLLAGWRIGVAALLGLLFVISVEQWESTMMTLSQVLVATVAALVVAIPIGILAARSERVSAVVRPVLDLMQTMPAFVWLVPVVTLFSIGVAPGVVATWIFCLPPGVRLTELGIRQVDEEVVEAGQAFGGSPRQVLRGIQLPLALPTLMAGVNQVIMLALSMAVIAGLVGAPGLGQEVVSSISNLDIGLGFEAGLSVVVLAIYLDRVTAAVGHPERMTGKALVEKVKGRFRSPMTVASPGT